MNNKSKGLMGPTPISDRGQTSEWSSDKLDPNFMEGLIEGGAPPPSSETILGGSGGSTASVKQKSLGGSGKQSTLTEVGRKKKGLK